MPPRWMRTSFIRLAAMKNEIRTTFTAMTVPSGAINRAPTRTASAMIKATTCRRESTEGGFWSPTGSSPSTVRSGPEARRYFRRSPTSSRRDSSSRAAGGAVGRSTASGPATTSMGMALS